MENSASQFLFNMWTISAGLYDFCTSGRLAMLNSPLVLCSAVSVEVFSVDQCSIRHRGHLFLGILHFLKQDKKINYIWILIFVK